MDLSPPPEIFIDLEEARKYLNDMYNWLKYPGKFNCQKLIVGDGGTTDYTNIDQTGDVFFVGGAGLQFGCMHGHNVADEILLADQDTWYQIPSFDANGESNGATPDHTEDHITIITGGRYLVMLTAGYHSHAANLYEIQVQKNDGTTSFGLTTIHFTTAVASQVDTGSTIAVVEFAAGDTVEAWTQRTDGGDPDKTLTIDHIGLVVIAIGGIT